MDPTFGQDAWRKEKSSEMAFSDIQKARFPKRNGCKNSTRISV